MPKYAVSTEVSVERSRAEIERVLDRYGARGFAYAKEGSRAMIGFRVLDTDGRVLGVRMYLPLPDPADDQFALTPTGKARSREAALAGWEQACRSRWRALLLVVKAKLEAVDAGISTIEREFLPDLIMPDGRTVLEHIADQRPALEAGGAIRLLPSGGADRRKGTR